jgi:hypothetical protein
MFDFGRFLCRASVLLAPPPPPISLTAPKGCLEADLELLPVGLRWPTRSVSKCASLTFEFEALFAGMSLGGFPLALLLSMLLSEAKESDCSMRGSLVPAFSLIVLNDEKESRGSSSMLSVGACLTPSRYPSAPDNVASNILGVFAIIPTGT